MLDVADLGEAIAILCETPASAEWREVELGGSAAPTMVEYLAALRARRSAKAAMPVSVPAWLARIVSHICDVAHFSPFSYGHLELLRRDNVPCPNLLPRLIGRESSPLAVLGRRSKVLEPAPVALRRPAF